MSAPALRLRGLGVDYAGARALAGVDLDVPAGGITALVGPSGCGKSSLLATINRMSELVPGCRVTGEVRVGERDVYASSQDVIELRRRVGLIFQRPNPFPFSIAKNITLALREHQSCTRAEEPQRVERALRDVGLWDEVADRLDTSATRLSGGQQQRLCLARALALEPEVLLLDEPCSALDPIASARVEEHIAELRGRYTMLVVTHNLAQARRLAERTALFWVRDGVGGLVEEGPTEELFERPRESLTKEYVAGAVG